MLNAAKFMDWEYSSFAVIIKPNSTQCILQKDLQFSEACHDVLGMVWGKPIDATRV